MSESLGEELDQIVSGLLARLRIRADMNDSSVSAVSSRIVKLALAIKNVVLVRRAWKCTYRQMRGIGRRQTVHKVVTRSCSAVVVV